MGSRQLLLAFLLAAPGPLLGAEPDPWWPLLPVSEAAPEAVDEGFADLPDDLRDAVGAGGVAAGPAAAAWRAAPASLLFFRPGLGLRQEIGLGAWREDLGGGVAVARDLRGGVSKDGRYAWHWQKAVLTQTDRDAVLAWKRALVVLGPDGTRLWRDDRAGAPQGLEPVLMSDDGETLLVSRGEDGVWGVSAVTAQGRLLRSVGPLARLERMALTGDGRFAMVLGAPPGGVLTYTLYDLRTPGQRSLPASEVFPARPRLTEDGRLLAGSRTVLRRP